MAAMATAHDVARLENELLCVRKELAALIESTDRRITDRLNFEEKAREVAAASVDHRLHTMNEFREAMANQANLYITRNESSSARGILQEKLEQQIAALHTKIEADLKPISLKQAEAGKPNWMLLVASVSVVFALVAGGWLVVGLKIDAAISPVAQMSDQSRINLASNNTVISALAADVRQSTAADSASRADRGQLNERLGRLETVVSTGQADRRSAQAAQAAALTEIETQFKALSNARNQDVDQTERVLGLLWARVYKEPYPATQFRPTFYRETH